MSKTRHITNIRKAKLKNHFRVTIFGSARIKKGDKTYTLVYDLAKLIGKEGMDIVTGGGPGLMDAASSGHFAGDKGNKAKSIGLAIHLPREQRDSHHLEIKKEFHQFSKRLDNFMYLSNAVVVAPGGVGTLLEFLYAWQLVQVHKVKEIPIILLGDHWNELLDWIKRNPVKHGLIGKQELEPLFCVKTAEEAMEIIRKARTAYKLGDKDICKKLKSVH